MLHPGTTVRCVNNDDVEQFLVLRRTYEVVEHLKDDDELVLRNVKGSWKSKRFHVVRLPKSNAVIEPVESESYGGKTAHQREYLKAREEWGKS